MLNLSVQVKLLLPGSGQHPTRSLAPIGGCFHPSIRVYSGFPGRRQLEAPETEPLRLTVVSGPQRLLLALTTWSFLVDPAGEEQAMSIRPGYSGWIPSGTGKTLKRNSENVIRDMASSQHEVVARSH